MQGGPKNRKVFGPQNFVKLSVEKQTIYQNFQNYV